MEILEKIYDSEINWEISAFWDGGFDWRLGDENGWKADGNAISMEVVVKELAIAAATHFPRSAFAEWWKRLSSAPA